MISGLRSEVETPQQEVRAAQSPGWGEWLLSSIPREEVASTGRDRESIAVIKLLEECEDVKTLHNLTSNEEKKIFLARMERKTELLFSVAKYLPQISSFDKNPELYSIWLLFDIAFREKPEGSPPSEYQCLIDSFDQGEDVAKELYQELEIFSDQKNWVDLYRICNDTYPKLFSLLKTFATAAEPDEDYKGQSILNRTMAEKHAREVAELQIEMKRLLGEITRLRNELKKKDATINSLVTDAAREKPEPPTEKTAAKVNTLSSFLRRAGVSGSSQRSEGGKG